MLATVTGATGHLGANLISELLERGIHVRATIHRNPGDLAELGIETVEADVLDRDSLLAAFRGSDVVYHLAAVISITGDPDGRVEAVNVDGASNAAEAARDAGVGRFVHCSSIHAFDTKTGADVIDEESPRVPAGSRRHAAYDISKAEGERRVRGSIERGLNGVIVHPTSVIGPNDPEPSRMGRFFRRLEAGSLPSLVRGGYDFVDVRDVVAGTIAAAEQGTVGASYLLGGNHLSVRALAEVTRQVADVRPPRLTVPRWMARLGVPFIGLLARLRDVEPLYTTESLDTLAMTSRIDHGLAERELGYTVRPIEETVRDIYRDIG